MKENKLHIKSMDGKKELEFVSDFSEQLSFVVSTLGPFGSGKSRLLVTGPDITAIIPEDQKTRRTVENTMKEVGKKFGKNILMPPADFLKPVNPMQILRMEKDKCMELYRERVERMKDYLLAMHAHPDVRLICCDTATGIYNEIRYANYGRDGFKYKELDGGAKKGFQDKTKADQEYIDLIRALASKPLILTHKSKDEYFKNKQTGRLTWEGFKFTGHNSEAVIEHESNSNYGKVDKNGDALEDSDWHFAVSVIGCQSNVELQGEMGQRFLKDEEIVIRSIMEKVFPETDWSDWE